MNAKDPLRRLKIGYVSADFRRHSVAYFAEAFVERHDRTQVEVFCYYNNAGGDAVTQRFIALADHWIPCHELDDDALATRIRGDGIDILVDLAGHTAHHRLPTFARKPAPVQVTYLGYPATTGLTAIDYRFTDSQADPAGSSEVFYRERLVRLPVCFLSYRQPESAVTVASLPAINNGFVTFGSFNALPKITPRVIELWARILTHLPTARIVLKASGFEDGETRGRFLRLFARHGVAECRVSLCGKDEAFDRHLERYNEIDIALDPFPYNGTTTTFEAMWMGVPTITLSGDRHAARVGTSLLANAGLHQFIAQDVDGYLAIALQMTTNLEALDALRSSLRNRLLNSPLVDPDRLARALESTYRQLWRAWCNQAT